VAEAFKPWNPTNAEEADGGRIIMGLIGHPNVGKSSVINDLFGDKVVSVKATPGHTKTLQTMNLDDRTCLCDSPGVVFPRLEVPREAQIVGMLIPHGQVREPFSAIRWVMEHATTPLQDLLGLKPVTLQKVLDLHEAGTDVLRLDMLNDGGTMEPDDVVPWSPMLICAQYATQRGLVKYGRPDCNAAGMELLQRVLDGRVPYTVTPPAASIEPDMRRADDNDSEANSDYGVDEAGYESEEELTDAQKAKDLLQLFDQEEKHPGSCTIRSRKKWDKKAKALELEKGTSQKPAPKVPKNREETWDMGEENAATEAAALRSGGKLHR